MTINKQYRKMMLLGRWAEQNDVLVIGTLTFFLLAVFACDFLFLK